MLLLRLKGYTYSKIAKEAGISRQRVQQLLSPPKEIREYIYNKYDGCCADCGILIGRSGHIHHENSNTEENYQDINNLVLLCISCHLRRHFPPEKRRPNSTLIRIKLEDYDLVKRLSKNHNISHADVVHSLLSRSSIITEVRSADEAGELLGSNMGGYEI